MPKTKPQTSIFSPQRIILSSSSVLHILSIKRITPELEQYIDKKLGKLTYGDEGGDLARVKRRIIKFLEPKKGTDLETGVVAEFFVHLYLSKCGLNPKFLIANLEENSLKKGFDGFYTDRQHEWLCESKSGSLGSSNVDHGSKVREAYRGLKDKLAGKDPNNPWSNAFRHAQVAGAKDTLKKKILALSNQFEDKQFHKIDDFHIIPCATIYLDGNPENFTPQDIETRITKMLAGLSCNGMRIICITKESVDAFWQYLKK